MCKRYVRCSMRAGAGCEEKETTKAILPPRTLTGVLTLAAAAAATAFAPGC